MRKLILAATALAFVSSTALAPALAQDKAAGTTGTAAQSGDSHQQGRQDGAQEDRPKKVSKAKTDTKTDTAK